MARTYGVAVVGCGVGRMHVEAWQALPGLFAMRAVVDINGELAKKTATELKVPEAATDLAPLLQRSDIDIVDVSTPPATHLPLAEQALAAGKHVVLEKPLVGSLADVDRLAQAAKAAKGRLMPIFQYRFSPGILKLKRLVDAGIAGKLYLSTIETAWKRGAAYYAVPWRGKWATELGGCFTAHAIHAQSERRDKPFVALNCAAIPENLIESELFGYREGAFTGAKAKGEAGKIQLSSGGTLFLDEIGDMPLPLQTRLLRVLAEGEVLRLGVPSRRRSI